MRKPLHILFLARWYPNKSDQMYGLFVKRHAEAAALRHQVSVLYVQPIPDLIRKHEIEVHKGFINEYFYYYRTPKSSLQWLNSFTNFYHLIKGHWLMRRKISKPDIVHVHILTRLGVIAYIINKWKNIPYLIHEHWSRYLPGNRGYSGVLRKWMTRLVVSNAEMLTTVTENLYDAMKSHGIVNEQHQVLPNVIDTKIFFPASKPANREKIRLVHVSCFDDEPKNISGLLYCIQQLSHIRQDFTAELIGTGKDFDKMKSLANELQLSPEFVSFTGLLEGTELGNHIRQADIMMLFSNYENMPVVINEALACGIPVISTDVGGIREVITPKNGRLVPKGDRLSFVNGLLEMMDNLKQYDPHTISHSATSKFSIEAVAGQLDEIYTSKSYT